MKETIHSVLQQTYSNIEYIIIDGESTDNTHDIISDYTKDIAEIISEPDAGMYDALVKGFMRAKGDIICYINAGDLFQPYAIQVAVDIFKNPNISWITGCRTICNEDGVITHVDLPFRYKSSLIRAGSYGRYLPFIQQESTFWRVSLLESVDFEYLRNLKLAGDYYLWWCFASRTQLEVVSSSLGIFRFHKGQLSEHMEQYYSEIDTFVCGKGLIERAAELYEKLLWALHPKLRAKLVQSVMRYNHRTGQWEKKYT